MREKSNQLQDENYYYDGIEPLLNTLLLNISRTIIGSSNDVEGVKKNPFINTAINRYIPHTQGRPRFGFISTFPFINAHPTFSAIKFSMIGKKQWKEEVILADTMDNVVNSSKRYAHNLMFGEGVPSLDDPKRGFYLYRDNEQVFVLVVHAEKALETMCLSNIDSGNLLNAIEWPNNNQEKQFIGTELSDDIVSLITSNCEHTH